MIFVTGDIHGDPSRLNSANFNCEGMTKNDYVVILGDFGLVWSPEESSTEQYWLDWLERKPFTTLFIDGNHENFDRLNSFPVVEWHGGKVHKIRDSVIHLMRGQVFNIDGKKCFTFGGARSHDISDGIIDPSKCDWRETAKQWKREGKYYFRVLGISWWPQELPTEEEKADGLQNLTKNNWDVDFVFTHDCSSSTSTLLYRGDRKISDLNRYLEDIQVSLTYKKWFFGHHHHDMAVNPQEIMVYQSIIQIN